jgi:hypothetical protein
LEWGLVAEVGKRCGHFIFLWCRIAAESKRMADDRRQLKRGLELILAHGMTVHFGNAERADSGDRQERIESEMIPAKINAHQARENVEPGI